MPRLSADQRALLAQLITDAVAYQEAGSIGCPDCDRTDPLTVGACERHHAAFVNADSYRALAAVLYERGDLPRGAS